MQVTKFVQSYFDAWNHCDAEGVAEHLAKNGTYYDIPIHKQHSRDDLASDLAEFFANQHQHYHLIGDILTSDKTVAFQYKVSPEDPAADDWFGAEFMTLKGDGAVKISDYYDPTDSETSAAATGRDTSGPKYAKSGLHPDQMKTYTRRLAALMYSEKVYLESDLTMLKLAALVDCSVNHLSQAVNSGFGMNFFDFLNSYRVEDAKMMLGRDHPNSPAILEVPFAVGFNSNSAFYAAFKKATGQTPAQYRRTFMATEPTD